MPAVKRVRPPPATADADDAAWRFRPPPRWRASRRGALFSAALKPASASTSALCSPTRGGWRVSPGRARSVPNSTGSAGKPTVVGAARKPPDCDIDEPAVAEQVRIGEQVGRVADRRPRHGRRLAAPPHLGLGKLADDLAQRLDQPVALTGARLVGGKARIGGERRQIEGRGEAHPLLVARHADEELFAVGGVEHVVERRSVAARCSP